MAYWWGWMTLAMVGVIKPVIGGGNDSPEDGAAYKWSDFAVGFEEWDDAGTGQRVEGVGGNLVGG